MVFLFLDSSVYQTNLDTRDVIVRCLSVGLGYDGLGLHVQGKQARRGGEERGRKKEPDSRVGREAQIWLELLLFWRQRSIMISSPNNTIGGGLASFFPSLIKGEDGG